MAGPPSVTRGVIAARGAFRSMLPRYFRRAAQGGVIRTQGSGYFGSPAAFAATPGLRLDEHAETIKAALPELKHRPSEYVKSGRYFQSIEIPEGAALTNMVADLVGDHVLIYASDYPHGESHFPESAGLVTAWNMDEQRKRKLLWDNAARFYARAQLGRA